MNDKSFLENRLRALGEALRQRPAMAERLMVEVRNAATQSVVEELNSGVAPHPLPASPWEGEGFMTPESRRSGKFGKRKLFAATLGAAAIGVALTVLVVLLPAPAVSWGQVVQEVQQRPWIRAVCKTPVGTTVTMWFSPQRKVWATSFEGRANLYRFCDGTQNAKYEQQGRGKNIVKLPLGSEEAQGFLPTDALADGKDSIGPWLFGIEKIVGQTRRDVVEDGKNWIEFELVLWRGPNRQAVLRVDPTTRLPVYFSQKTAEGADVVYTFDYPAEGPEDIYALGAPRDAKIEDLMPGDDAQRVLTAMAAQRASLGNFVLVAQGSRGHIVSRKGDCWRIDVTWPGPPPTIAPHYLCDGKTVWENKRALPLTDPQWQTARYTGPQDLMSGDLSSSVPPGGDFVGLVWPHLTPSRRGEKFEFDAHPADAPGCVLFKRSAENTNRELAHEWRYVDPAKGYAVVRAELFNSPLNAPADPAASKTRQTITMDNFVEAMPGLWYPTVIENSMPTMKPDGTWAAPQVEITHYQLQLNADLPDALFKPGEAKAQ